MAPPRPRHADEGGQLQPMEADRIEEEESFESINEFISQGISAGDVKKLQDAGIYTCNGLMMHAKKSHTGIKGLSEANVERIREAAEKLLNQGFMTGSDPLIKNWCPATKVAASLDLTEADRIKEEDENCFVSIDELISQEINAADVKRLQDAGINTCNALMMHGKKSLTGIKGLSEAQIEKICHAAGELMSQRFRKGNNLLINKSSVQITTRSQGAAPSTSCCINGFPKQTSKQHTNTSAVTESVPRPLPADIMDNLAPFALLVRLISRAFYSDVSIEKGEVKTGCKDNCGIAVVILDSLTRHAWINEKQLAKLLKIKEKNVSLLLKFLEKEMFLKRETVKRAQVKIDDATVTRYGAHDCHNFGENESETLSILPGRYYCLDYSQVYNVIRYRFHRMKEFLKDKIGCGNKLEEQIEDYFCRICNKSYSSLDAMHLLSNSGATVHCEICNDELIARKDLDGPRKEMRKKFVDMAKRMKEQLRPLEEQLNILKDMSIPEFPTLKQWTQTNMVYYIPQTKVESSNTSANQNDCEATSKFRGSKVLPLWITRKGMALKKADKGSNNGERQVGVKSKRDEGGSGNDYNAEFGCSARRRI